MSDPKLATIYCRVSTRGQAEDGVSLLEQDRQARLWCEAHGFTTVKVYHEPRSGKNVEKRLHLQTCVRFTKQLKATLVVYDLTRAARSLMDAFDLVNGLGEAGCGFVSLSEGMVDTTTPQGQLVFTIFAAMAEFQRKVTAQKTRESLQYKRRAGERYCNHAPYGYAWEDNQLVEAPKEQRVIRLLRVWISSDRYSYGRRSMVRILKARRILKRNDKYFDERTVRELVASIKDGSVRQPSAEKRPKLRDYNPLLKIDNLPVVKRPEVYGPPRPPLTPMEEWEYYLEHVHPNNKYGTFVEYQQFMRKVWHPLLQFESEEETPKGFRNPTEEELSRRGAFVKPKTRRSKKRYEKILQSEEPKRHQLKPADVPLEPMPAETAAFVAALMGHKPEPKPEPVAEVEPEPIVEEEPEPQKVELPWH